MTATDPVDAVARFPVYWHGSHRLTDGTELTITRTPTAPPERVIFVDAYRTPQPQVWLSVIPANGDGEPFTIHPMHIRTTHRRNHP